MYHDASGHAGDLAHRAAPRRGLRDVGGQEKSKIPGHRNRSTIPTYTVITEQGTYHTLDLPRYTEILRQRVLDARHHLVLEVRSYWEILTYR